MLVSKINTSNLNVQPTACPPWCVTVHDDPADPLPCWSEDLKVTLTQVPMEQEPGQDEYATLHAYVELAEDGRPVIQVDPQGQQTMTPAETRQHIAHLLDLLEIAES